MPAGRPSEYLKLVYSNKECQLCREGGNFSQTAKMVLCDKCQDEVSGIVLDAWGIKTK